MICSMYYVIRILWDVLAVQIIIEKAQNEKNLVELDKSKFLVPEELTMSQLVNIIRYSTHYNNPSHLNYYILPFVILCDSACVQ